MSSIKTIKKPILKTETTNASIPLKTTTIKKSIIKITEPNKIKTASITKPIVASNTKVGKLIKKINSKIDSTDKILNIPNDDEIKKQAEMEAEIEMEMEMEMKMEIEKEITKTKQKTKTEIETETETETKTEIETETDLKIKTEILKKSSSLMQVSNIKKQGAVNSILTNYKEYSTLEKFKNFALQLKYAPLDQVSPNYKNLYISNGNIQHDIVPIIIKLSDVRIRSIYNVNSKIKQSIPIWLSINNELLENAKLLTFLTRLENEIERKIKEITSKILQKTSCITKHPRYYHDLKINAPFTRIGNCLEFPFTILGKNNKPINFTSIARGTKMNRCYIELENVWISDTAFGINWTLKRANVKPESIWKKKGNVFDDEEEDIDDDDEGEIIPKECFHCMYCPNNHVRTHCCLGTIEENKVHHIINASSKPINSNTSNTCPPPPPPPLSKNLIEDKPSFIPSLSDLLAGKSRLKAVSQKNNENVQDLINKKINEENNIVSVMNDVKKTLKSFE